ncbi:MAG: HupE/UreJ family protein [Saprospiraceae bacterium]|nr:HupE/UreJ family protein [Lewinella sp.]
MHSEFKTYLQLGFEHIADLNGYDHILFIVVLCAVYQIHEWRKVGILVTAFTIGHSLTLALAALDVIRVPTTWVEFLIPVTIFLTALYNVIIHKPGQEVEGTFSRKLNWNYLFAMLFGLIHGMGFSNFFRSMQMPGEESSLVRQLLAFNIGVELGQLTIVAFILLLSFLGMKLLRIPQRDWNLFISGMAAGPALIMIFERIPS